MQDTFEALRTHVLPAVKKGRCRVTLREPLGEKESRAYIEAYPHDRELHSHFEWMWLLAGEAHLKIEGRVHPVMAGDFCLLPPQTRHADVYGRDSVGYESLWFSHWPSVVHSVPFSYAPFGICTVHQGTMATSSPEIQSVLLGMQRELAHPQGFSGEMVQGLLLHLVTLLLRTMENQRAVIEMSLDSPSAIGQVSAHTLHYLYENYGRPLTLKEIAGALYLSPNYLATVFKRETGQTVFGALARIRMERAMELLHSSAPLHDIAEAVGYTNLDGFTRTFRQLKGFPPSHYIRPPHQAMPATSAPLGSAPAKLPSQSRKIRRRK